MELKKVFATPDGKTFETKAEAENYLRRPKIKEAMLKVTGNNAELADWLIDHQESVEMAFETGTIRRVTKSEHAKLAKALEALKAIEGNPKIAFLQDNAAAILESFRWPSVKRMTDAEKATAARNTLIAASDNEELADWILANRDAVLEAFQAGKVKREVNPKAAQALAEYQARKRAEKEAAAAAAAASA